MDSQVDLDSDCEIQEPNISIVTVADETNIEIVDIEEGELDEVDENSLKEDIFTIAFKDETVFHEIGHSILNAIQFTLNPDDDKSIDFKIETNNGEAKIICTRNLKQCSLVPQDVSVEYVDMNDAAAEKLIVKEPPPESNSKESSPDLDLAQLFMIDTEPAKKLETIKVPSYKRAVRDVLEGQSKQKSNKNSEIECKRIRPMTSCFNCGSAEHALFQCPKTRNPRRILKAKKAFGSGRNERYHVDIEQRFAHKRPGVISDKLNEALGLRRGELPFFFYRMRVLGYPPGWLEDAKVSHSGITLFNSEGKPAIQPENNGSEIDANQKYDASKIVGFPGFNVDPGKKFFDDYKHHNVPPLCQQQLRAEFIKELGDNVIKGGYKRKKLVDIAIPNSNTEQEIEYIADMEVEDNDLATETNVVFSRPMPPPDEEKVEVPPPPPPLPISPPHSEGINRTKSPSLEDLEAQQEKLLQELKNNTSSVLEQNDDDSLIDEVLEIAEGKNELDISIAETQNLSTPNTPTTPQESLPRFNKSDIIKESHMGTPLLKFSPFDQLPAGENFKVGVSDVINFENLPDSTGKYEQMKVVIKKVRKVITKLYNEDD